MVKSQLIDLLRHFRSEELQEFRLFVASPFFNRGHFAREVVALTDFILAGVPAFSETDLARAEAYRVIFPDSPIVEGKLDKVMSELHKLAKEFISITRYLRSENEFRQLLDQAIFYRTRALDNRHRNVIERLQTYQHNLKLRDQDFFERDFLLDNEIHSYENLHNQRRGDVHIQKTLQSLDLHYFLSKIELLNRYLLQQKVTRLEMSEEMMQTIRESGLPERFATKHPVLLISYKIFQFLEKQQADIEVFGELHQLLHLHEAEIQPDLLKFYYTYLRNFCSLLINTGRSEFLPVIFTFQKEHLERGYLYYENKISPSTFLNTSITALLLKEYEWAKNFILSHRGRIVGDNESQDYYHLTLANFLFHTGQFDQALDILPQSFHELAYHNLARRLELKIYYELNSDLLPYKIDAFKMYLSRASKKVISALVREQNTNFVNLLFQLSTTAKGDSARAQRLVQRIQSKQSIAEREWLLEKSAELA